MAATQAGTFYFLLDVSTHSHPKVAAFFASDFSSSGIVSTHSHPKVAAKIMKNIIEQRLVSTHSHPKVAAQQLGDNAHKE